ncbi:site-specific integrase [Candidatus Magnetaquicoccus inordinatus]|uniref:site-specific integrase n=1 Tax=Candidatus Magnetaquicoccus inordinatus TaxID=2496818 RepID=UPI00102BE812|nr:site-specific integrase [Candidatus Magnetaquicoccus inordinatus]
MQAKISKRLIDSMATPEADTFLWDTETKGFGVKFTPAGKRIYLLQYRHAGRLRRYTIGQHGSPWTPDQARQEAVRLLGAVSEGKDPAESKAAEKSVPTIADVAERFQREHVAVKNKPRTVTEYRRLFDRIIIPQLGKYRVDALQRSQIAKLHNSMQKTPYQANRVIELLSILYNWMESVGIRPDHTNPIVHIKQYREEKRERILSDDELLRLGQAIADTERSGTTSPYVLAAIRLLILTGARLSEILTLTWGEVDFQYGVLRLADSKTGAKNIPLNPPALELLATLPRIEDNPHVIVGKVSGHAMVNINRAWRAIREAAGMPTLRIHDLRHAYASIGASMGMSLPVIGKLLGHTQAATTQRYAHLSDDPLKKATRMIGEHIHAAMTGKAESDNIIPLTPRQSTGG